MYIVKMRLCHLGDNATGYLSKTSIPGTRTFLSSFCQESPGVSPTMLAVTAAACCPQNWQEVPTAEDTTHFRQNPGELSWFYPNASSLGASFHNTIKCYANCQKRNAF